MRAEPSDATLVCGEEGPQEATWMQSERYSDQSNLVGKVNNLLTTDLVAISNIQDLLQLRKLVPVETSK